MSMQRQEHKSNRKRTFVGETNSILKTVQVDNRVYRRRLTNTFGLATNGLGVLAPTYAADPSGSGDWASCSALYDEFRVVGMAITIVCRNQNSLTNLSNGMFVCFDNDDASVLTSYQAASEYQNSSLHPVLWNNLAVIHRTFSRPSAANETALEWRDIGNPSSSPGAIKLYADGLSTSSAYFFALVEYAVEFRGVR